MPLFHDLIPLRMTGGNLNEFLLLKLAGISVTLRVRIGVISKELIGSFEANKLGWSLSLGVDGNVWKVQIRERCFNLIETIIKIVSEGATKLLQEGVRVAILPNRNLLSLTELIFCLRDLSFLVLE